MRQYIIKAIITLILTIIALVVLVSIYDYAYADYFVLCKPDGEVNIREKPKLKSAIVACAFFGDRVETDGKRENGFVHVVGLNAEQDTGWIYGGLLVEDKPIASEGYAQVMKAEKVACRKYASKQSKVKRWLKEGQNVKIYSISEKWCVTEYGYVMTEFLTVNAPVRGYAP